MTDAASLKYIWYGDDFTGASDTLATFASSGLRALLCLGVPRPERMKALRSLDALGIAGAARTMSPEQMIGELEPVGHYASAARVLSDEEVSDQRGTDRIKARVGLVAQQDARIEHQRPGQSRPLAHPARQLSREQGGRALKSDVAQARAWYEKAAEYGSADASRLTVTMALAKRPPGALSAEQG